MGISGLLPLLKEIQVDGHISNFKGKTLAVDAYVWLHKGAFGCAEDLVKGKKTTKFVDYAMHRVRLLRYHGITPYVVFDGGPLPAKKGTEVSRAKSRVENLDRARAMESQGRWREARDFYTRCLDITPEMAYQLIKALRAENVDYVVAPYEADAQLCFLEREGYVDGIITEDSDLLVFGCRQVIFKLDGNGQCVWIHRDNLAGIKDFPMHGWTDDHFRRMAMLSGCDYLDSIPGIGLKTAHRLLRRFNTVEKLLQHIRLEGSLTIPSNYLVDFAQAELAFIHQRVYHPHHCRLVPLNDFPEGGLNDLDEKWIGLDVEQAVAKGMARGDLHPETRLPIVDEWPGYQPVARARPLAESSKANLPLASGAGPMDAFVTRMKKPRPLPRPVTFGSGPSRLPDLALSRQPSQSGPSTTIKRSKFFSKRIATPEPAVELVWEDSDEVESQPLAQAGPSRSRSRSECRSESVRSPSPAVSSVHADSPAQSAFSDAGHVLTSPGAPLLSSPPCSTPGNGIPFTTPRNKEPRIREDSPMSPTGATVDSGSVLIAASSQLLEGSSLGEGIPASVETPIRTERRTLFTQTVTRLIACSSPVDVSSAPDIQPEPRHAPRGERQATRAIDPRSLTSSSSDTIDDAEIVTPSVDMVGGRKRKRVKREVLSDDIENVDVEEDEQELKRRERAKAVAKGWSAKYAFDHSSSPAPVDTPKVIKRTQSDPTPRHTPLTRLTPAGGSVKKIMPITAQAGRILMPRSINVPLGQSASSPSLGRAPARMVHGNTNESEPAGKAQGPVVGSIPTCSSPISEASQCCSASGSGKSALAVGVPVGGKTWTKLQKYKMAR
ncbi:hypothetical protein IAU60_001953 [Kwoniella sp. DSM 27419]